MLVAVLLHCGGGVVCAETVRSAAGSLSTSERLDGWSVGIGYVLLERDVLDAGRDTTLDGTAITGFLGYDVCSWLTVFATGGATQADLGDNDYLDAGAMWSAGLVATLWKLDVRVSEAIDARLSLGVSAEYGEQISETGTESLEWDEMVVSLPLGCELFADEGRGTGKGVYSLVLYGGPAVSWFDGVHDVGGLLTELEADQDVGFVAGADLYLLPSVRLRGEYRVFGGRILDLALRYHF